MQKFRFVTSLMAAATLVGCQSPTMTGADAWVRADQAVRIRGDTISSINVAKRVAEFNLKNAETTGYKATRCEINHGTARMMLDATQGSPTMTNRNLDVTIQGEGFFKVKVPRSVNNGEGYTRDGNFTINKDGDLVVNIGDGYKLLPPITLPRMATDISISPDGAVSYVSNNNTTKTVAGTIQLSTFVNMDNLMLGDMSVYLPTDRSGPASTGRPGDNGSGSLLQGYLESSNVELDRERLRIDFLNKWLDTVMR